MPILQLLPVTAGRVETTTVVTLALMLKAPDDVGVDTAAVADTDGAYTATGAAAAAAVLVECCPGRVKLL